MRIICLILILCLFPIPAQAIDWRQAKQTILSTRDHPEIMLIPFAVGAWLLTHTKAGKAFYKTNLKGDFRNMAKAAKGRRVKIK